MKEIAEEKVVEEGALFLPQKEEGGKEETWIDRLVVYLVVISFKTVVSSGFVINSGSQLGRQLS